MKKHIVRNNRCSVCGRTYHRRNLVEAWTKQNIGHRDGWRKEIAKICTNCQSSKLSQRVFMAAQVAVPQPTDRKQKQN